MRLLCRIGLHRPAPDSVWNAGHCFARCRGCGRDLVRRAGGRWAVPRGYRVVWKSQAEVALDILLARPDPEAGRGRRRRAVDLPIQDVLRQLRTPDIMKEDHGQGAWDAEISLPVGNARARVDNGDFMRARRTDVAAPVNEPPAEPMPRIRPRQA
ncbi:MAG TPA: hypothetical protein VGB62_04205 [Allosphingosinicella sp.]|jgi:hypothetical protein